MKSKDRPQLGEHFGAVRIPTAAQIMARELPPVRWVVPDILPEGVTVLGGRPKFGKSWMVLGFGVAVATGGVALGRWQVEQGEVLYLALEDNERRIHNRLDKLLAGRPAPPNLHIPTEWPRLDEEGADLLDDWVTVHPDTRLVIVDTLAMLKPRTKGTRTQYDEDREAVSPLTPIASDHSVSILLVHHLREAESDDPLDMIHGSAGLTGGVDGALVLKRKRGQADAYLHVDGRDIENPTELALKFDQNAATWAIVGDAEEYRLSEQRRAIIRVLETAHEPLSPKEMTEILNAKGMDISYGAVRELLSQMVKDGQVKNQGRGQYVLPDRLQNSPDNADSLTNGKGDVSLSGLSGDLRKQGEGPVLTCIHGYASGKSCYLCDLEHPFRKEQRGSK